MSQPEIIAPHWLPPHEGYPMGRPAPTILTEAEAMLLLRIQSKHTVTDFIRRGLKHTKRSRCRVFLLVDVLDFARRVA